MRLSQYAGVTFSMSWRSSFAALFSRMSTPPASSSMRAKTAFSSSILVRSHLMNFGAIGEFASDASSARDASSAMSRNQTRAPWRAKATVSSPPMPLPPPVITTRLPARSGYVA